MQVVQSNFKSPVLKGSRPGNPTQSQVNRYGLYLVKRKTAVYFRCIVPPTLRDLLGKREIIRSLGTVSQRVARPIGLIIGSRLRVLFVKMISSDNRKLIIRDHRILTTLISDVCKHIPVICMVKRTPKIHYIFEGQKMDVTQIYSQIRKRRGRAKILANAQVEFKDGLKAKLVFVRNKHKKDWLALLTTNVTLADEDVVRIYGKRWDIEVFFRTAKQHLELEKGCQSRDFDALIAHTTIVMARYIFLSIEKRRTEDPRTLGLLFHRCCEEAEDCTLVKALSQILGTTLENMKKLGEAQNQAVRILLEAFRHGIRSLGRNFDYIFNEQRLLAANG